MQGCGVGSSGPCPVAAWAGGSLLGAAVVGEAAAAPFGSCLGGYVRQPALAAVTLTCAMRMGTHSTRAWGRSHAWGAVDSCPLA